MKKCILVWQVPVIEGEPYNPVEYAVHVRKAKKFAEALNRYFAEKNMDYNCVLDKSASSVVIKPPELMVPSSYIRL